MKLKLPQKPALAAASRATKSPDLFADFARDDTGKQRRLLPSVLARATFVLLVASAGLFTACSDINNSWEVKGGGYIKYSIDNSKSYTIELEEDDVEVPYINNSHLYLMIHSREEASSRGDVFTIMVNRPVLGDNAIIQSYSKFNAEGSEAGIIYSDSSNFHIDQKDDSTWTADMDLYAEDCRSGECSNAVPRIHITGRFRYWIPADER